jgi:hypothetical protein
MTDFERGVQDAEDEITKLILVDGIGFWKNGDLCVFKIKHEVPKGVSNPFDYRRGYSSYAKTFRTERQKEVAQEILDAFGKWEIRIPDDIRELMS